MKFVLLYMFSFAYLASFCQIDPEINFNSANFEKQYFNSSPDCAYKLLKKDLSSIEMEERPLFYYTHPKLKSVLKDEHLLKGMAHLFKVEDNIFLVLKFEFNSPNARRTYGDLDKQSKIKVSFNNGDHIYLQNIERDRGKTDRRKRKTYYEGVYPILKPNLKQLKRHLIYKMGVMWEEGYEEYEILNIDLIKNQIKCLE